MFKNAARLAVINRMVRATLSEPNGAERKQMSRRDVELLLEALSRWWQTEDFCSLPVATTNTWRCRMQELVAPGPVCLSVATSGSLSRAILGGKDGQAGAHRCTVIGSVECLHSFAIRTP